MLELKEKSPPERLNADLEDFDGFLLDHAAAERKASAVAVSLITHYPDRRELVIAMMDVAREELEHFHQVYQLIDRRGGVLGGDAKDAYVRRLRDLIRRGREEYFLDRLLVSGIVEARGRERFALIAEAVSDPDLADFYRTITASEERHEHIFVDLAGRYFPSNVVRPRLEELLDAEDPILRALEIRAALH